MKKLLYCCCGLMAALLLTTSVCSAQTRTGGARRGMHSGMMMGPVTDTGFLRKNLMDNLMEIRLAEIGRDNATSDDVRKLADQLVTEHTQILNDLTTVAGKLNVAVPDSTTMTLPSGDNTDRAVFDKTWLTQMAAMHHAKVQELQMAAPKLTDPQLKAAAMGALPKIKLHTQMLDKLNAQTKASQ